SFETTIAFFKNYKFQLYICCGDIVGYGPNPNECIELLKTLKPLSVVMGNHDAACVDLKDLTWFNEYAKEAIIWTRKQLTEPNRMYISELPKVLNEECPGVSVTIAHGSPRDPIDEYLLNRAEMIENLNFFNTDICFVGHTHVPFIFMWEKNLKTSALILPEERKKFKLQKNYKYIVNVGSVGQPRDNNPKACFAIYDSDNNELEFFRLSYEFTKTQMKMYSHRLPMFLIERLTWGR
ncbi:MAG: metallophosphoesterase family protein, partial [Elusimicrobiota bacterium]|nr:metallophosphoesterase family protein [Elusimicrobiota bacterium]